MIVRSFTMAKMRRAVIAAAWIAGTTLPLMASAVMLFGCCILPFHRVIHRVMPMCHTAIGVLHGDAKQDPQAPARAKQEPVKRIATTLSRTIQLAAQPVTLQQRIAAAAKSAHRSFVTLGALRCDQDVGLHLFVATLLI